MTQEEITKRIITKLEEEQNIINKIVYEISNLRKLDAIKGGGLSEEKKAISIHKKNIRNHLIAMYVYILLSTDDSFDNLNKEFNSFYSKLCNQPCLLLDINKIDEIKQEAKILNNPIIQVTADVYLNAFDKNNKLTYVFDNINAIDKKNSKFVNFCKNEMYNEENKYLYTSCSKPEFVITGTLPNGLEAKSPLKEKNKTVSLDIKNKTITFNET